MYISNNFGPNVLSNPEFWAECTLKSEENRENVQYTYARFIGKILSVSKLRLIIKHLAASQDLSYEKLRTGTYELA